VEIKVGLLITNASFVLSTEFGYATSAGAIVVAMNKAIKDGIYNPDIYNISFVWRFPQCDHALIAGFASHMIKRQNVSMILG
jgi:hypothetical protein